jgi:hypothetical protein
MSICQTTAVNSVNGCYWGGTEEEKAELLREREERMDAAELFVGDKSAFAENGTVFQLLDFAPNLFGRK